MAPLERSQLERVFTTPPLPLVGGHEKERVGGVGDHMGPPPNLHPALALGVVDTLPHALGESYRHIRDVFPTTAHVVAKYEENTDKGTLYMCFAFIWDIECGYLRANLVEHGATRELYDCIAERDRTHPGKYIDSASGVLFQAATRLDEPALLTLTLLWNPNFVPIKQHGKGKGVSHVGCDDICDYFTEKKAPRCSTYWQTIFGDGPHQMPSPPFHPTYVVSALDLHDSTLPDHVKQRQPHSTRKSLTFHEAMTRPPIWSPADKHFNTILVCQFKGLRESVPYDMNETATRIAESMFTKHGYTLLEATGLRFAFQDTWKQTLDGFERHCQSTAASTNAVLMWVRRLIDPGTGLFLYGDTSSPCEEAKVPLNTRPRRQPKTRRVCDLMRSEVWSC